MVTGGEEIGLRNLTKNTETFKLKKSQKILLKASIYVANIYSFEALVNGIILSQLDGFYRRFIGFILSILISWVIVSVVDFILRNNKLSYLGYSLSRFFIAAYINVAFAFLIVYISITLNQRGEFILREKSIIKYLFYPTLLYGGFLLNLIFSKFAFADQEEYLRNNPRLSQNTIVFIKTFSFLIFVLSYLPIFVLTMDILCRQGF